MNANKIRMARLIFSLHKVQNFLRVLNSTLYSEFNRCRNQLLTLYGPNSFFRRLSGHNLR